MKKFLESLIFLSLASMAAVTLFFLIIVWVDPPERPRNICSVAEISPDVTPEERKRCREIRSHKL